MITTVAAVAAEDAGHWGPAPFWPFFIIFPLTLLLIAGVVIALFARRRRFAPGPWAQGGPGAGAPGAGAPGARARSAEQVLADRFAQGDIDETEYRARLEVLRANRPDA